jgi:hypothetical protein
MSISFSVPQLPWLVYACKMYCRTAVVEIRRRSVLGCSSDFPMAQVELTSTFPASTDDVKLSKQGGRRAQMRV